MTADHDHLTADEIRALDRAHVLHSWSTQSQISPFVVAGAEGRHFWGEDGRRILDFASLVVNANLGHQHPRVVEAIAAQAHRLCATAPAMTDATRARLAGLLAEVTPGDLTMSLFTNGGAEATENAIKLARWYTGRHKIVARYRSYHGATAGAVAVTGDPRRWPAEPGIPGVVRMFDPYPYRCPAGHAHPRGEGAGRAGPTDPGSCPVCSGGPHLEEILQYEGAAHSRRRHARDGDRDERRPRAARRLPAVVREVCDRHGILLILDEVMVGFGRTGRWFACEHWDVVPDIMTVAKGITSGYRAAGRDGRLAEARRLAAGPRVPQRPHARRATRSPAPPASRRSRRCATRRIVENAAAMGEVLAAELPRLAAKHPCVGEVRGLGLLLGASSS